MAYVNAENAPFFEFVLQVLIKSSLHYQSGRHTAYRHLVHIIIQRLLNIHLFSWLVGQGVEKDFSLLLYKIISCRGVFYECMFLDTRQGKHNLKPIVSRKRWVIGMVGK